MPPPLDRMKYHQCDNSKKHGCICVTATQRSSPPSPLSLYSTAGSRANSPLPAPFSPPVRHPSLLPIGRTLISPVARDFSPSPLNLRRARRRAISWSATRRCLVVLACAVRAESPCGFLCVSL